MDAYKSSKRGAQIDAAVEKVLSPDATPTEDSNNLVTSGGVYTALAGKENISNKVISWSQTPSDTNYPSEKLVHDGLAEKYVKPNGGIPKTDLASDVQTSLGKADNAVPYTNGDIVTSGQIKSTVEVQAPVLVGNSVEVYGSPSSVTYVDSVHSTIKTMQDYLDAKQNTLEFNTAYDASTNKVATMADVKDLIPIVCPQTTKIGTDSIIIDDAIGVEYDIVGYKIYGKSMQDETPSTSSQAEIYHVGNLVESGSYAGKYKIPIRIYDWDYETDDWNANPTNIINIYLNNPLRGLSNGNNYIADYIEFTQNGAKVVRKIGVNSYDGSSGRSVYNKMSYSDDLGRYILNNFSPNNRYSDTGLCNYFQYGDTKNTQRFKIGGNMAASLYIADETLSNYEGGATKEGAITWLASLNPSLQIVYVLNTDTEETIDLPSLKLTPGKHMLDLTDVSSPSKFEVTYYQDINKAISGLQAQITEN